MQTCFAWPFSSSSSSMRQSAQPLIVIAPAALETAATLPCLCAHPHPILRTPAPCTPPRRSMVLTDDLDNNGRMDLLVSTMNGNVYAFETSSPYHPLKAWPQQVGAPARRLWGGVGGGMGGVALGHATPWRAAPDFPTRPSTPRA